MSENSRKRSRKDKLVPRDCNMDVNESMQEEPYMKLMNIKSETEWEETETAVNETVVNKTSLPHFEFSVNVEVEEYSEVDIKEEPLDSHNDEVNSPKGSPDTEENSSKGTENPSTSKQNLNSLREAKQKERIKEYLTEVLMLKEYKVTPEDLLKQPEKMSLADQLLYIELRNAIGRSPRGLTPGNKYSKMIEVTITHSKIWYFMCKHGEYPVFYKCYICSKAWWRLYDFWEHIQTHQEPDFNVYFEEDHGKYSTMFNIIAFTKAPLSIVNIPIEGDCWQCGKDYDHHVASTASAHCSKCNEMFRSCRMEDRHQGICREAMYQEYQYHCSYCSITYFKEDNFQKHMISYHTVRSDLMALTFCKVCSACKEKYLQYSVHICPKKRLRAACKSCNRRFPSATLAELHELTAKPGNCPICNKDFKKSCMIIRHIAESHSKNFQLAYKCILCEEYLVCLSYYNLKQHMKKAHCVKYDKRRSGAECVMLPKSYFDPEYIPLEGDPTPTNLDQSTQEGTTGPESVSQDNADFIKTEDSQDGDDWAVEDTKTTELHKKYSRSDERNALEEVTFGDTEVNQPKSSLIERAISQTINEPNPSDKVETITIKTEIKDEPVDSDEYFESDDKLTNLQLESIFRVIGDVNYTNNDDYCINNVKQEVSDNEEDVKVEIDEDDDSVKLGNISDASDNDPDMKTPKLYRCTKCGFEDVHKEYKVHIDNNCNLERNIKFPCSICKQSFKSLSKYLKHLVQHGLKYLSCPECSQQFRGSTKLAAHVSVHLKYNFVKLHMIDGTSKRRFQCKKCVEYIESKDFFMHWETHLREMLNERGDTERVTTTDGVPKKTVSALDPGILKIMTTRLQYTENVRGLVSQGCVVCTKRFSRLHDCKRHIIEHLLDDAYASREPNMQLICQICGDAFMKADRFKYHMRLHGSMPLYKCEQCDKSFSDSSNFTKHKKIHNFQVYTCDICRKKFLAKLSLEKHIELHKTVIPTPCSECNKVFHTQSAFKKHVRCRHSKQKPRFICIICKKRFESLKSKWDHLWEVHKERKSVVDCHICNKSFRKYQDLKFHIRNDHRLHMRFKKILNSAKTPNSDTVSSKRNCTVTNSDLNSEVNIVLETPMESVETFEDGVETLVFFE